MAFDGIVTNSVIFEIQPLIVDSKIEKIEGLEMADINAYSTLSSAIVDIAAYNTQVSSIVPSSNITSDML